MLVMLLLLQLLSVLYENLKQFDLSLFNFIATGVIELLFLGSKQDSKAVHGVRAIQSLRRHTYRLLFLLIKKFYPCWFPLEIIFLLLYYAKLNMALTGR